MSKFQVNNTDGISLNGLDLDSAGRLSLNQSNDAVLLTNAPASGNNTTADNLSLNFAMKNSVGSYVNGATMWVRHRNVTAGSEYSVMLINRAIQTENSDTVSGRTVISTRDRHTSGAASGVLQVENRDDSGSATTMLVDAFLQNTQVGFGVRSGSAGTSANTWNWQLLNNHQFTHNIGQLSTGDFILRGETDANVFYMDASADNVGIGTGSPSASYKLHTVGAVNLDGGLATFNKTPVGNRNIEINVQGLTNNGSGIVVNDATSSGGVATTSMQIASTGVGDNTALLLRALNGSANTALSISDGNLVGSNNQSRLYWGSGGTSNLGMVSATVSDASVVQKAFHAYTPTSTGTIYGFETSGSSGAANGGSYYGFYSSAISTVSSTNYGYYANFSKSTTNAGNTYGFYGSFNGVGANTQTGTHRGIYLDMVGTANGTLTTVIGADLLMGAGSSGQSITTVQGLKIRNGSTATSSITTLNGLDIDVSGTDTVTNRYAATFVGGNVGIGTASPDAAHKAEILGTDATSALDTAVTAALYAEDLKSTNLAGIENRSGAVTLGVVGNQTVTNGGAQVTGQYGVAVWSQPTTASISLTKDVSLIGVYGGVRVIGGAGSVTASAIAGFRSSIETTTADVTITKAYGMKAGIDAANVGTISEYRGLFIPDMSGTTGAPAEASRYGIYQADAGDNYFNGRIGLGTLSPAGKLHVQKGGDTTGTNTAIHIQHTDGGTSTNYGIDIDMAGSTSVRNQGIRSTARNSSSRNVGIQAGTWANFGSGSGVDIAFLGYNGNIASTSATTTYTSYLYNQQTNTSNKYGQYINLQGDQAAGTGWGEYITIDSTFTSGTVYGTFIDVGGTTPTKYGTRIIVNEASTSNIGLDITVSQGTNNYAMLIQSGDIVFNNGLGDYDVHIKGDTDTYMLYCDASADSVGMGTANPAAKLHVLKSGLVSGAGKGILVGVSNTGSAENWGADFDANGTTSGRNRGIKALARNSSGNNIGVDVGTWGSAIPSNGSDFGLHIYNSNSASTSATTTYGVYSVNAQTNTATKYGGYIALQGDQASGTGYGLRIHADSTYTAGTSYGSYIDVGGTTPTSIGQYITVNEASTTNTGLTITVADATTNYGMLVTADFNGFGIGNPDAKLVVNGGQSYVRRVSESVGVTTVTVDFDEGNTREIDMEPATGDVTVTLSNGKAGAIYTLKIIQGSGGHNLVWPAAVKWADFGAGGGAPTITPTNNRVDMIQFYCDSVNYYPMHISQDHA